MSTPTKTPDASKCPIAYAIYGIDTLGRHFLHDVRQPEDDDWSTDDGGLGDRWAGNVLLHTNQEELELRNSELTARIAELEKDCQDLRNRDTYRENLILELRNERSDLRDSLAEARKDSARLKSLKLRIKEQIGWVDFDHLQAVQNNGVELSGDCIRDLRNMVTNLQTLSSNTTKEI